MTTAGERPTLEQLLETRAALDVEIARERERLRADEAAHADQIDIFEVLNDLDVGANL